jgi:hypothetical protein
MVASTSTRQNVDYDHPRWLRYSVAGGAALLYGGLLIAANVFPHFVRHAHGWPFVYMARDHMDRFGGLSYYYAPWPIENPPLLWFAPELLVIDVLLGVALTVSVAFMAAYWLRARRRPLQFSLRGMLGLTTAISCLVALIWAIKPSLIAWIWFGAFFLVHPVVSVVFCLLVVTEAHWLVCVSARTQHPRRWWQLHWLTWIAAAAMAGPLVYHCFFAYSGILYVGSHPAYGWPSKYVAKPFIEGSSISYFNPLALMADVAIALTVLAATVFAVERWIRRTERGKRTPIFAWLAAILIAIAIVLVLGGPNRPDWYVAPFWLFGIASTIFFAAAQLVRLVAHTANSIR